MNKIKVSCVIIIQACIHWEHNWLWKYYQISTYSCEKRLLLIFTTIKQNLPQYVTRWLVMETGPLLGGWSDQGQWWSGPGQIQGSVVRSAIRIRDPALWVCVSEWVAKLQKNFECWIMKKNRNNRILKSLWNIGSIRIDR